MKAKSSSFWNEGSLKYYILGFVLSILLTAAAFSMLIFPFLNPSFIFTTLFILAGIQLIVHLTCFLQINTSSKMYWNSLGLIYTLILLVILVGASIWVMFHLNQSMAITG